MTFFVSYPSNSSCHRGKLVSALIIFSIAIYALPSILSADRILILSSVADVSQANQQIGYRVIQYPLPRGSSAPFALAIDKKSGIVWFVEQGSNQIGMLDPTSGVIKEYSIPTPNSTATGIAVDSMGNVWFSELSSNHLGELSDGSIIEFTVPAAIVNIGGLSTTQSCGPTQVVPDAEGHIWVICIFSNQIDEFFPENRTFLSFDLPVFQSGPAGLVFDRSGNFWFTAADSEMIGRGIVSELRNGTSSGISEFPPSNQTYSFSFQKSANYLGSTEEIKSSLPTPSGIAVSPDGTTLWITEHVDDSFDSFNIQTSSLDRYWTSQTYGQYGYPVSLPNGIAIDNSGNVWIAEHYGNKVAEFNPTDDRLVEYDVPCCNSSAAGVYTLTLGQNGTVWFVEILGDAIGELVPLVGHAPVVSVNLGRAILSENSPDSVQVPLNILQIANSTQNDNVSLGISGITGTGSLAGALASFNPPSIQLTGNQNGTSHLDMTIQSLRPGIYDLTVSATLHSYGVIYSTILKLIISTPQGPDAVFYVSTIAVSATAAVLLFFFIVRPRRK